MSASSLARSDRWTLLDLVESLGAAVYGEVSGDAQLVETIIGGPARSGVVIDARQVQPGDVFVPLQGANAHGMSYAEQAFERGACAVLAGTDLEISDDDWEQLLAAAAARGPVLVATDCDGVTALGRVARAWRRRMPWRVIGITGSSGKTSTKDLLARVARDAGWSVVASHANWNNEIGVPLTLLDATTKTDVVICEMGMRGIGQIAYLCDIADPDIGIVTTVGTAHLELLGSVENIVRAKAEMLGGTWRGGVGIFPASQPELVEAAQTLPDRLLPFGATDAEADDSAVLITSTRRTDSGIAGTVELMGVEREFRLPVHGLHQARNLAAAAAAVVTLTGSAELLADDVFVLDDPADPAHRFTAGRGDRHDMDGGGLVMDDAYNANPESMVMALEELAATAGARRVAVLGRMAELGDAGIELHARVGEHAASLAPIDELVVVGDSDDVHALADGWIRGGRTGIHRYVDVDDALAHRSDWLLPTDTVLVKASNSAGLRTLAAALISKDAPAVDA